MKKRILALLAATVMTMSLVACGSDKDSSNGTTEGTVNIGADVVTEQESVTDIDMVAERGTIANDVYTNKDFNISFPIPSGSTIYSDEQIAQMLGIGQNVLSSTGNYTAEQMETAMNGTFYDVWFAYPDGMSNAYVAYENMKTTGTYGKFTAKDYVTSMKQQFSAVTAYNYSFDPDTTEILGGETYECLNAKTDAGIDQKIYIRQVGNYMLCLTLSYKSGDTKVVDEFTNSISSAQ